MNTQHPVASVQWLNSQQTIGVVRVHAHGPGRYGDPYEWAATVHGPDDTAEILGVDKVPTVAQARAVARMLADCGFDYVTWDRVGDGLTRRVALPLARYRAA